MRKFIYRFACSFFGIILVLSTIPMIVISLILYAFGIIKSKDEEKEG